MREVKKTRVAVFGCEGRMGKEIVNLLSLHSSLLISGTIDQSTDLKNLASYKPNVVVEFSSPRGLATISNWCLKNKVSLVSGTTGIPSDLEKKLKIIGQKIPVFRSANMSLGVNALARALKVFVNDFSEADIQIEEIHHRHKKDAPSGTAKFLHETLLEGSPRKIRIQPTVSIRGGEIFGIHRVYFFAKSEWICFEHQALNRAVFAEGALRAAEWLAKKRPGYYSMSDLLGTEMGLIQR